MAVCFFLSGRSSWGGGLWGFGLLELNPSATARGISRLGLLGLNASATARVISRFDVVR